MSVNKMENLHKEPDLLFLLSDIQVVYNSCISEVKFIKKQLHFIYAHLRYHKHQVVVGLAGQTNSSYDNFISLAFKRYSISCKSFTFFFLIFLVLIRSSIHGIRKKISCSRSSLTVAFS